MDRSRYFDHAATTPVDPMVLEAMLPFLGEECGNAHSIHQWGLRARNAVERARESVALLLGVDDPGEIVFTSGATESNNTVLASFGSIAISPFEHSSVREPALARGAELLPNDGWTLAPGPDVDLVSVMAVNNETGAILEMPATSRSRRHCDATQAIGKVAFDAAEFDFVSCSAHKFYGPKGVGVLTARGGEAFEPLLRGGGHENGLRAGTLNVPGIVGMGAAAGLASARWEEDHSQAALHREALLTEIASIPDHRLLSPQASSPFIVGIAFDGVLGEALVIELDRLGFAISSGSACSSGSTEPSTVLMALGLPESWIRGAIRVSFGRENTPEAVGALAKNLAKAVLALRTLG